MSAAGGELPGADLSCFALCCCAGWRCEGVRQSTLSWTTDERDNGLAIPVRREGPWVRDNWKGKQVCVRACVSVSLRFVCQKRVHVGLAVLCFAVTNAGQRAVTIMCSIVSNLRDSVVRTLSCCLLLKAEFCAGRSSFKTHAAFWKIVRRNQGHQR